MQASRIALLAAIGLTAMAETNLSFADDGIKWGDNNNVTMNGQMDGNMLNFALGRNSNAQGVVGGVATGGGWGMGSNNQVSLTGRMDGNMLNFALGTGANAQGVVGGIATRR